ncbi:MAG: threonine synthase [Myxococcales bacterium]|nr:threonine synthase [Myxococcales bacterium]
MIGVSELCCFHRCEGVRFAVTEPIYRCPNCRGLLEVVHDVDALRETSAAEWKSRFQERAGAASKGPKALHSGVWDKREWVMPGLADEHIVSLGEGRSTLSWARQLGASMGVPELYVKQCGQSPTGSFKDLGMTVLVSVVKQAIAEGRPIRALACASTGDTSAALAAYGAQAGLPVVVLLPRGKISTAQLVQPLASGAKVLALDGDFDQCMRVVDELAEEGRVYLANSMNALRLEGQKSVAFELAEQLDWQIPDFIALPSGNLGNGYALYLGLRLMLELGVITRLPRLILAQAESANPLYRAFIDGAPTVTPIVAGPTLASAIRIGNPVSATRALKALAATNGLVEQASEQELCELAARADRTGLSVCPHTAVALAAVSKLARAGIIAPHHRVVVISTASALKFTEFKVRYHEGAIPEVRCEHANAPVPIPATATAVRAWLD